MKILINSLIVFMLCVVSLSCSKTSVKWTKGPIAEEGVYTTENIQIKVETDNDLVQFEVTDHTGRTLFRNPHAFSALHRWALYLDNDESLWVFSSDIGHYIFRKKIANGEYEYSQFSHFLTKEEIPGYMYNDLKSLVSFK